MIIADLKKLLPIMQAFAEGKTIQYFNDDKDDWEDISKYSNVTFENDPDYYRIKPELKYRPFKSVEECWNEMHKHSNFGWLKNKKEELYCNIVNIYKDSEIPIVYINDCEYKFSTLFNDFTFIDGSPFGIEEE